MPIDLFMYWSAYLDIKKTRHQKSDYQLALISKMVAESNGAKPQGLSEYLIRFETDEQREERQEAEALATMARLRALPGAKHQYINETDKNS